MGKKSTPAAPDYAKLAEQTADSSKEVTNMQTWANRANQSTPWGDVTWDTKDVIDPATGQHVTQWSQNTNLSAAGQQQFDAQQQIATDKNNLALSLVPRMQQEYSSQADWSKLSPYANVPLQAGGLSAYTNPYGMGPNAGRTQNQYNYSGLQDVQGADAARQQANNAMYSQATSRLDPQWQGQQSQLESQLANKGITAGSAAYQSAMDNFQRQKTDAYNQAQLSAYAGGTQAAQAAQGMDLSLRQQQAGEAQSQGNLWNQMQQQRFGQQLGSGQYGLQQQQQAFAQNQAAGNQNFNQTLQAAQFQNQQRQQQLSEMMQQRGFSLNEINAILNGTQVSMPQFGGYNQAAASQNVDYSGAGRDQYSASMDAYNAKQAQQGQMMGAVAGLGAAAMTGGTSSLLGGAMGFSDRRLKTDIRPIGRHPRGYRIVSYRFIGERRRRVGVIAQEVARVAPELVHSHRGVLMVHASALP